MTLEGYWRFPGASGGKEFACNAILWPPDAKSRLIGKDSEAGKDQEQEKKVTEGEMVDSINGHEFEQTLGDSEGEGSLACCNPWDRKELDMT